MSNPAELPPSDNPLVEARRKRARAPKRRLRSWAVSAGIVLAVLLLFCAFGLPPILRSQLPGRLSRVLNGRTVTIGKIHINPLVLSADVNDFKVTDPDGSTFIEWKRVYVNFDSFSLLTGRWRFQELSIDQLKGNVSLDQNGVLNFHDLLPATTQPETETASTETREKRAPRPIVIKWLRITDTSLHFADASRERPFETTIGPITLDLRRFSTAPEVGAPYQFDAVSESGEHVSWKGTVALSPFQSEGEFEASGIRLEKYAPYYAAHQNGVVRSGTLDISGRYHFALGTDAPGLRFERGQVRLSDFAWALDAQSQPFLAFRRFSLSGLSGDTAASRYHADRLRLEDGNLRARRLAAGALDVLSVLASKPAEPARAVTASASAQTPEPVLPDLTLGSVEVGGFSVDFTDEKTARPARLSANAIDFALSDFSLQQLGKALPLHFSARLNGQGNLGLDGTLSLRPFALLGKAAASGVGLAPFSPYLESQLRARLADGAFGATGDVRIDDEAIDYKGAGVLEHLSLIDSAKSDPLLSLGGLALDGLAFRSAPFSVHLDLLTLDHLVASLLIDPDGTLNLTQVLAGSEEKGKSAPVEPTAAAANHAAQTATKAPQITVNEVRLQEAKLRYEDRSIEPAASAEIALDGSIQGLSSEQLARADVDLRGTVDGSAPIAVKGKLNPLGQPAYSHLAINFKGIDLPPIASPYMGKYVGQALARGNLDLNVDFTLQDDRIDSANVLTIDQFTFGQKTNSPDATKLPVGLAVALLKDTSGKIVIDLPVKGALDDPNFKIGRVVLRVITNLLVKAATSPFSLLGAALGGGGGDSDALAYQVFQPGAVEPGETELAKLQTVAKALAARPALLIDVQGAYDPVADKERLQQDQLAREIRAHVWESLRAGDAGLPPPDALVITPQQETDALWRLYLQAFPVKEGMAVPLLGTSDGELIPTDPGPVRAKSRSADEAAESAAAEKKNDKARVIRRLGIHGRADVLGRRRGSSAGREAPAETVVLPAPESETGADFMTNQGVPVLTPDVVRTKLAATMTVTEDDLRNLANERAKTIRAWLTGPGQVAPDRVFVIAPSTKGARVDFTLR